MTARFTVLLTPLINDNRYGDIIDITENIDITDFIRKGGLGSISRKVDSEKFDIGLFNLGNIKLKAFNFDGKFNDPIYDTRSLFPFSRDRAKIEVIYTGEDDVSQTIFRGISAEESSVQADGIVGDSIDQIATLTFLEYASIFRKVIVDGGTVGNGSSFSDAIKTIINQPGVTSLLNFDANEVNVSYDGTIGDASFFDNLTTRAALDNLLLASNSVLLIDETDTMIVQPRAVNAIVPYEFFGAGDPLGRENIIRLKSYKTGLDRTFNSVTVNDDTNATSDVNVQFYGLRQKAIELPFITDTAVEQQIADTILDEFKFPRPECEIIIKTELARDLELLDEVRLTYDYIKKPYGDTLPILGVAILGEAILPQVTGNIKIEQNFRWKIIEIKHTLTSLQSTVKLRALGNKFADSVATYS